MDLKLPRKLLQMLNPSQILLLIKSLQVFFPEENKLFLFKNGGKEFFTQGKVNLKKLCSFKVFLIFAIVQFSGF